MDRSTPSTSKGSRPLFSQRKRLSLGHLGLSDKQSIINIYKQILDDEPETKIVNVVSKISQVVGVAKSTTYRVLKEYRSSGTISSPKNVGGRPGLLETFDEGCKNAVRRIVHDFLFFTLNTILQPLKKRLDLPQIYPSSLYTFLKHINFKYLKRNRQSILIERDGGQREDGSRKAYQEKIRIVEYLIGKKQDDELDDEVILTLGNGISAYESVPTAIYCFLKSLKEIPAVQTDNIYRRTIQYAVSLGGDTDTIASMAGAIAGAYLGEEAINPNLAKHCEFSKEIVEMADNLFIAKDTPTS